MKKMNLIKCFFIKAKILSKLNRKLEKLEEEMLAIRGIDNKVEALVKLFQVIAPFYDEDGFSQEISLLARIAPQKKRKQIEALRILQMHIKNVGRSEHGMNRTTKGEPITLEKVYLGGIYGLRTKTADYWLSKKEQLEKDFHENLTKNPERPISTWYLINDYQCGSIVKSCVEGILSEIKNFRAA